MYVRLALLVVIAGLGGLVHEEEGALPRASGGVTTTQPAPALAALLPPPTFSWGLHHSTTCAEDPEALPARLDVELRYRAFAEAAANLRYGPRRLAAACRIWDVPALGARVHAPVRSDVPSLLLSGEFDNVTPARYAEEVAASLTRARTYTLPDVAHAPISGGVCPLAMIAAFVDDPARATDARCIAGMAREPMIPWASMLLPAGRAVFPDPFATKALLLLASALLLLSALLLWPLQGLRGALGAQRRSHPARWLAGAAAGLDLAFVGVYLTISPMLLFLIVFILEDPSGVLEGYPAVLRVARGLPWIALGIALAAGGFGLRAWREPGWRAGARLHFTAVVLAALAFSLIVV